MSSIRMHSFWILAMAIAVTAAAEEAPKAADAPKKVLATIGKEQITVAAFQEIIDTAPANVQPVLREQKDRFLNDLVNEELLFQKGQALKMEQDPLVKAAMQRAEKQIIVQRLLQKQIQDKLKLGPDEAKQYYEKNKEQFVVPERARASHILVKDEKLANDLLARIKKGADFSALAQENSVDPSKMHGGDLGFFEKGRMTPDFEKAAFALKPGEVSGVVKTEFGYHIIKLAEYKEARPVPFPEVQEQLTQELLGRKQQDQINAYLEGLRKETPVKVNTELLKEVK